MGGRCGAGSGIGGQKVEADRLFHGGGDPIWEMPAGALIRIRAIKGCTQILEIYKKWFGIEKMCLKANGIRDLCR